MNRMRSYLRSELTPKLSMAIGGVLVLLVYIVGEALLTANSHLAMDIRDKRISLHQMASIQSEETMKENLEKGLEQNEILQNRLLTDETDGLNDALFQTLVTTTLEACGASNISLRSQSSPILTDSNLKEHVVSVRTKLDIELLGKCMYDLAKLDLHVNVSSMRWAKGGLLFLDLKSYSAIS